MTTPRKLAGLITRLDFVGFDEVQSITFEQPGQIQQALKHYMEFGEVKGFDVALTADAGVIVLPGKITPIVSTSTRTWLSTLAKYLANPQRLTVFMALFPVG